MNTELAAQRPDGRWHWTINNPRCPKGYCRGWQDWTQEQADRIGMPLEYLQKKQEEEDGPFREKFHTDGHETKEDAERCYYEYCLDHAREGTMSDQQCHCRFPDCEEWSQKYLGNPGLDGIFNLVVLCDEHRNREGLEAAHPFVPGIWIHHS
jgi:hypothetical protein